MRNMILDLRCVVAKKEQELRDHLGVIEGLRLELAAREAELSRLRAVNAELVEALEKKIARGVDCPEGIIKRPDFYASQDYFEHIATAALSRAKQTKMEVEK